MRKRVAPKYCSGISMGHNDPTASLLVFIVKRCCSIEHCSLNKSYLQSKLLHSWGLSRNGSDIHLNEDFHPRFYMHMSA